MLCMLCTHSYTHGSMKISPHTHEGKQWLTVELGARPVVIWGSKAWQGLHQHPQGT